MFFSCPEYQSSVTSLDLDFETLRGKSIYITGASGMLPAALTEALVIINNHHKLDCKLYGVVRNKPKALKRFASFPNDSLSLIEQDVSKPFEIKTPCDVIIHAASQASPKYYGTDPVGTLLPNVIGTQSLLESARKNNATFMLFSSAEIYGTLPSEVQEVSEDMNGVLNPLLVRSCYAESKRLAETMCVAYAHQYGLTTKIVRPFHVYGPGMALDDGRIFADIVADVVAGRNIRLNSDGTAVRAFCFLSDAVSAFLTVLIKGKSSEAYNVGNPFAQSNVRDLAKTVCELFPERKITVEFANQTSNYLPSTVNKIIPCVEKLTALGWKPSITIERGFKRTIESYL